jgi:hypothetical protein
MPDGKLLGRIISERGIKIDLERVEAIQEIEIPINNNTKLIYVIPSHFLSNLGSLQHTHQSNFIAK